MTESITNQRDWTRTVASLMFQVAVVLIMLLVLPIADNLIVVSKALVLFAVALGVLSLLLARLGLAHQLKLLNSSLVTPLLLFGSAVLASNLLSARYPVSNFLDIGGFYLALVVVGLFGASSITKQARQSIISIFTLSAAVLAVLTWLQLTGYGPSWLLNQMFNLQLPDSIMFNLVGSPFIAAQVFTVALVGNLVQFLKSRRIQPVQLITLPLIVAGLGLTVWVSLPGKVTTPVILPYGASWSIALDVLRTPRSALIGVGAGNYGEAFQQFKPFWMNQTPHWNVLFTQAGNSAFTILTTMGLLGFGAWLWLLIQIARHYKSSRGWLSPAGSMVMASLLIGLIFPTNVIMLSLTAILLAAWLAETNTFNSIKVAAANKQAKTITSGLAVLGGLGVLILAYLLTRAHLSTYYLFQSTQAVIENRLVDSYRLQQQASQLNPYIDSTRRRYASTNLAIAVALSNKTDITETERAQVNQLIQQAIREARAASVISPGNSQNWRVLGTIYQNLIGVADSADQWTINTYVTAIETAPTDPTARIALAQVFFSLQQYDQASQLFAQSVNLKADLPNGLYGLANSLKEQGALTQAEQTYQQLLQTVSPSTDAYIQANKELQELRARIASLTEEETATLTEEEAPATDPTSQQPSLLEQTLNQDQNQLVNQPGAEPLPNDPFATDQPAPESNDQDQEATPSGVPQ